MDDFGAEAGIGPSAENRQTYDLDERVQSEADSYAGYEDDEDGEDVDDEDDEGPIEEPDSKPGKADDEEEEKEDDDDDDDDPSKESPPPVKRNTRAEKRIRQLAQKAKEKDTELENLRQENAKMQQGLYRWQMQQQQKQSEYDKQLALIKAENERYTRDREIQEEANLEPIERLQREAARKAKEAALAEVSPQVKELQQIIEEERQQRKREKHNQERDARVKGYEHQAFSATDGLLEGVEAKQSGFLRDKLAGFVLNWAAANNILPDDAAKEFDKVVNRYVAAKQAGRKRRNGQALARSTNTPKSVPNKRRSTKGGRKIPSYSEIQKQGFPDALAWMEAQKSND